MTLVSVCEGARQKAPLRRQFPIRWPVYDVIGVYRNLIDVPHRGKRAISWLNPVEKGASQGHEASGFRCGSVPRKWGMAGHMDTLNCGPK